MPDSSLLEPPRKSALRLCRTLLHLVIELVNLLLQTLLRLLGVCLRLGLGLAELMTGVSYLTELRLAAYRGRDLIARRNEQ